MQSADLVIRSLIAPLIEELRSQGIIDSWFFIRFEDPEHHLRLRLHLPNVSKVGEVIVKMYSLLISELGVW